MPQFISDLIPTMSAGEQLKKDLGLSKFTYVWLNKVLGMAQNVYIVTVDSRYPMVYLGRSKLKNLKSTDLVKLKRSGVHTQTKELKLTPAIDITELDSELTSNSLLLIRDISGEYFRNDKMFESISTTRYKIIT